MDARTNSGVSSTENRRVDENAIPVIEESLHVGKRIVEADKVWITKKTNEEEVRVDIPALHEEIAVEHIPVNRYVEGEAPKIRQEGDTTIIPVLKEVLVVEKRVLLVEEVRITKQTVQTSSAHSAVLRKEEVVVDRIPGNQQSDPERGTGQ